MNVSRVAAGIRKFGRVREIPRARRIIRSWISAAAAYGGVRPFPPNIALRNGQRVPIKSFQDLATFWTIFVSEVYPAKATDLRIIDAGANVGFFTLYAASAAPHAEIASIEPHPETFSRLKATICENGISHRVHSFQAALRCSEGLAFIDNQPAVPSQFRAISDTGIEVPTLGLDDVLDRCGWHSADLLKIDVEGSEYDALLAARPQTLSRVRRIVMEYHPRPDRPELVPGRLFDYLGVCGFRRLFHRSDSGGYGMAWFDSTAPEDLRPETFVHGSTV